MQQFRSPLHDEGRRGADTPVRGKSQETQVRPADDRWALLDALSLCAERWHLKARHLAALRVLLAVLPKDAAPDRRIVFPSNRFLCERLHGMPESTLRRHLAALVSSGLIVRRDSPNRKRFRVGRSADLVFGFDVSPFFDAASSIREAASASLAERQEAAELRARCRIAANELDANRHDEVGRLLRRKLSVDDLRILLASLDADDTIGCRELPPEPGVSAAQNDRRKESYPEADEDTAALAVARFAVSEAVCSDGRNPLRDLLAYLGIDDRQWAGMTRDHGPPHCLIALARMLPRLPTIANPSSYLRAILRSFEGSLPKGSISC